jgi:hypothetical protein
VLHSSQRMDTRGLSGLLNSAEAALTHQDG